MQLTDYHATYWAHELTKRCASDNVEKLAPVLADAQVDLTPHQVDAALFAFRNPFSKGAILADAQSESDFLLEPRRLTVAVSRPKRKLIVLASQTLFTLMPADLDDYERGALWKQLRHVCTSPPLWTGDYGGYQLRMFTVQEP